MIIFVSVKFPAGERIHSDGSLQDILRKGLLGKVGRVKGSRARGGGTGQAAVQGVPPGAWMAEPTERWNLRWAWSAGTAGGQPNPGSCSREEQEEMLHLSLLLPSGFCRCPSSKASSTGGLGVLPSQSPDVPFHSPNSCSHTTSESGLIWKRVFADVIS